MEIIEQFIINYELEAGESLGEALQEGIDKYQKRYSNDLLLIQQVIKQTNSHYVAIVNRVEIE
ncbi:hypothetical protein [Aneurinibacillus terranovensis]|uniref:hypothetical protein n=1 Tax=Aneurinibacillus terranovensis TaxID=278991 RepID=UPI00042A14B1|nr:hypothetical protein [Aneurinibacillus terranovensis]